MISLFPKLVTTDEGWNVDWLLNPNLRQISKLCSAPVSSTRLQLRSILSALEVLILIPGASAQL